jgi:Spy/CpxP family protein refolding chaperone
MSREGETMQRFTHRILFTALTAVLFLPLAGQAQDDKDKDQGQSSASPGGSRTDAGQRGGRFAGAQRQRQHMAMLAQELNLTDTQKEQFQQIGKDMRKQGMAIRRDSSLTEDQKKEKMLALRKQSHQQMFSVLKPEQKEKLKQLREQHKKEQGKDQAFGDQVSARKPGSAASDDDDPFAGMSSDDDGPGNGGSF